VRFKGARVRVRTFSPKSQASMGVWGCQTFALKGLKSELNGCKLRRKCSRRRAENGGGDGKNAQQKSRRPLAIQKQRHLRYVAAVEEVGADEGVEVTIENFLHVATFDFGAMVFD
jgi:hypothetical protein